MIEFNNSGAEWSGKRPFCRIAQERDLSWFHKKPNKKPKTKGNPSEGIPSLLSDHSFQLTLIGSRP